MVVRYLRFDLIAIILSTQNYFAYDLILIRSHFWLNVRIGSFVDFNQVFMTPLVQGLCYFWLEWEFFSTLINTCPIPCLLEGMILYAFFCNYRTHLSIDTLYLYKLLLVHQSNFLLFYPFGFVDILISKFTRDKTFW